MSTEIDLEVEEEEVVKPPVQPAGQGRWGGLGQPVETSANFVASARRLVRRLEGGKPALFGVLVMAVLGVGF